MIVDGATKIAMPSEQFIEFFQYAIGKAYEAQGMLNQIQRQKGNPTAYCKAGHVTLNLGKILGNHDEGE